ncbi:MAG: DUF2795 domain-containing protein [Bradymonadaceae bacterium]
MANQRFSEHIERGLRLVDYPALKSEIVRAATLFGFDDEIMESIHLLPDREYANLDDVVEHMETDHLVGGDDFEDELEAGPVRQHVIGDGGLERGPGSIGGGGGPLPPGAEDRGGIEAMQRAKEPIESGRAAKELDLDKEAEDDEGGERPGV